MVFGFITNMTVKLSQAFLEGKASLLLVPLVLVGIELLCVIQANFISKGDRLLSCDKWMDLKLYRAEQCQQKAVSLGGTTMCIYRL